MWVDYTCNVAQPPSRPPPPMFGPCRPTGALGLPHKWAIPSPTCLRGLSLGPGLKLNPTSGKGPLLWSSPPQPQDRVVTLPQFSLRLCLKSLCPWNVRKPSPPWAFPHCHRLSPAICFMPLSPTDLHGLLKEGFCEHWTLITHGGMRPWAPRAPACPRGKIPVLFTVGTPAVADQCVLD